MWVPLHVSLTEIRKNVLQATTADVRKATPAAQVLAQNVNVTKHQELDAWLDASISRIG